jgi:Putative zinc-finger
MTYPLRRSCKEVASLVVAMQDRPLGLRDRAALRFHMAICEACPGFEKQFLTMKSAMRQWRNYTDEPSSDIAKSAK